MPPCGICDFWRFPLNFSMLIPSCFPSCLSSGRFAVAGVRCCSMQSLFAGWGSPCGFGMVSPETPGPCAWAGQCHVPWVCS